MTPDPAAAWSLLPRAWGAPVGRARIRDCPEDFRVIEELGFAPTGEGEHLYLRIRKMGWNTADVAAWLARALGVRRRDVGRAGLKDRHALTEQWFAVHLPGRDVRLPDLPEGVEIVRAVRHRRKLRIGALRGNRFIIRLRGFDGDAVALNRRLLAISRGGVPNWFGEQRFGRQGGNLAAADRLFHGERVTDRHLRGLYLSAARGFLFNRVLAERVRAGNWNRVLQGDLMTFTGSRSLFPADDTTPFDRRLDELDLHPSGPLHGVDGVTPTEETLRLERDVLSQHADFARGLEDYRLRAERRALRVAVENLAWHRLDDDDWELAFSLTAGSYATAVLRELVWS